MPQDINRVEHIVKVLTNRAWSARHSGFVMVWNIESTKQLFVSVASCSPYPVDMFDYEEIADEVTRSPEQEALVPQKLASAWMERLERYSDSVSYELLYGADFGIEPDEEAESEGNWPMFRKRLIDDQADVLFFEAFGDLGVQLDIWRTKRRNALAPAIRDIAMLPTWHPMTWLPLLDSLLINQEKTGPSATAWEGFRAGEIFAKFIHNQRIPLRVRHPRNFALTSGQANFAAAWSQVCKSGSFDARVQLNNEHLFVPEEHWQSVLNCALGFYEAKDLLAYYCFLLGLFSVSNESNAKHLTSVRRTLDERKLTVPPTLSEIENAALSHRR